MFSNQTIDIPFLRENFASLSGQQKMYSLTRCYPPMSRSAVMQATSTGSVPAVECLLNGLAINQRVQVLGVQDQNASSFSIGYSGSNGLIELELSALESSGNGEVIARNLCFLRRALPHPVAAF